MTSPRRRSWAAWAAILPVFALGACSGQGAPTAAERGRQVYQAYCTSCHASDPAKNGSVGPAVRGSSPDLLDARILRGTYPPGYTPKQSSTIMQPLPNLSAHLSDLAAYLK